MKIRKFVTYNYRTLQNFNDLDDDLEIGEATFFTGNPVDNFDFDSVNPKTTPHNNKNISKKIDKHQPYKNRSK